MCQVVIVVGVVILFIGLLMLLGTSSSSGINNAFLLCIVGGSSVLLGSFAIRRVRNGTNGNKKVEERKEWRRFFIASSLYVIISIVLVSLNIDIQFVFGIPLSILCIYLFWSYVLPK